MPIFVTVKVLIHPGLLKVEQVELGQQVLKSGSKKKKLSKCAIKALLKLNL